VLVIGAGGAGLRAAEARVSFGVVCKSLLGKAHPRRRGVLRNAQGKRFMERYDPKKMELNSRDVVARASMHE
jgi:succinate dehydrogenase/fumarate reductase flavoprotein subunit